MKKTISTILIVIMMSLSMLLSSCGTAKAATEVPSIAFVGVEHSPLVVGDTETFYITSKNADRVQYRIFLYTDKTKSQEEITRGYTQAADAKIPYVITAPRNFALGKYKLIIWVRSEGSNKSYDSNYTAYLNCVARDDRNRIYANEDVLIDKAEYKVGEKVVVNGIKNLCGILGPYKYRLHLYNATSDKWIKNVTQYADKIEWTPAEPGTYVLDIHANTQNSTTWPTYLKKVNSQDVYGTYEAWKLKVITVTAADSTGNTTTTTPTYNPFDGKDIKQISSYGDSFIIKNDTMYLNDYADEGKNIVPTYTINTDFNKDLKNQVYGIADVLLKGGNFTDIYYRDSKRHYPNNNEVCLLYSTVRDPKIEEAIMGYTFYPNDISIDYANNTRHSGYIPVGYVSLFSAYTSNKHYKIFADSNKFIFGNSSNEVSKYISEFFEAHRNEDKAYGEGETIGNYMLDLHQTKDDILIDIFEKR